MADSVKRILLFDDDYESMSPLKKNLEALLDWSVELTASKKIPQRLTRERFDLICVDLMIHPVSLDANDQEIENVHFAGVNWQMTGVEFLKRLRRGEFSTGAADGTSANVPVIVLSAVADDSIRGELCNEVAVNEYVEKPFELAKIIEQMTQLLTE